jgi:hypothetical protein
MMSDLSDGRLSSTSDKRGLVQLNVRVPVSLKTLIMDERNRRKKEGRPQSDIGDIVTEALQLLFKNGAGRS